MNNYTAKLAESAVIGAILQDSDNLPRLCPLVSPDQFSIRTYREIYEELIEMHQKGQAIDILTVTETIPLEKLTRWGGEQVLIDCVDNVVRFENAAEYASLIVQKWQGRQLLASLDDAKKSLDAGETIEAIAKLQKAIIGLQVKEGGAQFKSVGSLMEEWYARLEALIENPGLVDSTFLRTGFVDFDKVVGGLSIGLNVLGARPGMGKTTYALCEALQVAQQGKTVLFVSLEMTRDQLIRRFASMMTEINSARLDRGFLIPESGEMQQVLEAVSTSFSLDLHFIDDVTEIDQIIAAIERWRLVNARTPHFVVIDYLGLIRVGKLTKPFEKVTEASLRLREYFTNELRIPCRLLHQLSRGVEERNDKRPVMSDLRDSGQIEQDATQITFLYRDSYYADVDSSLTEVITVKNREGAPGTIKVHWIPETTRFVNSAYGQPDH